MNATLTTHRHNSENLAYAEMILNTNPEDITGTAAYRNNAHKIARKVITEAIEDFRKNLSEVGDLATKNFISTVIAHYESILKG